MYYISKRRSFAGVYLPCKKLTRMPDRASYRRQFVFLILCSCHIESFGRWWISNSVCCIRGIYQTISASVPSWEPNPGTFSSSGTLASRPISVHTTVDTDLCPWPWMRTERKFVVSVHRESYTETPSTGLRHPSFNTAVFSYAIGSRKLSANEQFFVGAQTLVSLLQTNRLHQTFVL